MTFKFSPRVLKSFCTCSLQPEGSPNPNLGVAFIFSVSDFNALFQNCHELEKMDLEECVQVSEGVTQVTGVASLMALSFYQKAGCHFFADHRWNAHTALHPLSSSASSGELEFVLPSCKHC